MIANWVLKDIITTRMITDSLLINRISMIMFINWFQLINFNLNDHKLIFEWQYQIENDHNLTFDR
jgi:hypothetical protein